MPRGKKKTILENVKHLRLYNLRDGKDEVLLIAFCIALDIITPEEANDCRAMDGLGLRDFLRVKRDARLKELEP